MSVKKEKRYVTYKNRWGNGKVHRYVWSYENKVWYVACREPHNDPHGFVGDPRLRVSCENCKTGRDR